MILSDLQIAALENRIESNGVMMAELKQDLLDHICCCVETDMAMGLSFETAAQNAFRNVCPNGAKEIEEETLLFLNQPAYFMKKITYFIGLIASITMIIGILIRFFHWSASSAVFAVGLLLFMFVFLPLVLIRRYQSSVDSLQKLISVVGIIGAVATGAGASFKILHYPGADMLIFIGCSIVMLCILPFVFYHAYKTAV